MERLLNGSRTITPPNDAFISNIGKIGCKVRNTSDTSTKDVAS